MCVLSNPIDAVLFDLDGTLLDTTEAIILSFLYTVKKYTGREPSMEELQPLMGLPLVDVFRVLTPGKIEEANATYVEHNIALHKDHVKPYPGVMETVEVLKNCGVKLAIVTSKRRRTATVGLENAGLPDKFNAIVCHGDTAKAKPDPEPVLLALRLLGVDKPLSGRLVEVLFVGDSQWDVRAAKNAAAILPYVKMTTAAVTYGACAGSVLRDENPDYLLDSITGVLPIARCT